MLWAQQVHSSYKNRPEKNVVVVVRTKQIMHDLHSIDVVSDEGSEASRLESPWPCSILWTPIHPITWVFPFVGHLGITDAAGRLHDWGGGPIAPCHPRRMMFGAPARFIQFRPRDREAWDAAIARADNEYLDYIHCMLCGSDCHSHVARALNILRVGGCACHNKVVLAAAVFFCGRHTGVAGFVNTWFGFAILLTIALVSHFLAR